MSLQAIAQQIAAQGRGNDDQLVHMSRREVAGLQALAAQHGMRLPRNPQTGLIEANFLDSILPTIAGIGLMAFAPEAMGALGGFFGGGASLGAGLAVGAADTLATGSLKKGLVAGLGAYGGSEIGNALSAAAPTTTAISAAPTVGESAGMQNAGDVLRAAQNSALASPVPTTMGPIPTGMQSADEVYRAAQGIPSVTATSSTGLQNAGDVLRAAQGYPNVVAQAVPNVAEVSQIPITATSSQLETAAQARDALSPATSTISKMGQGLGSLGTTEGRSAFMGALGSSGPFSTPGYNQMFAAGSALAPSIMNTPTYAPSSAQTNLQNTVRPWSFSQTANPAGMGTTYMQPLTQTWTAGQPYNAITGQPMAGGGLTAGSTPGEGLHRTVSQMRGVERLMKYADGGISNLGSYSDGGQLLRGPGDGVSDSIPAQIGQHQPARLAEGEFVVPARIVSELGNGSTNAGAKQLYAMIDRIQNDRRHTLGSKHAYANDTKAARALPA